MFFLYKFEERNPISVLLVPFLKGSNKKFENVVETFPLLHFGILCLFCQCYGIDLLT